MDWKPIIITIANMGLAMGIINLNRIVYILAPSIRADSIMDLGTLVKKVVII